MAAFQRGTVEGTSWFCSLVCGDLVHDVCWGNNGVPPHWLSALTVIDVERELGRSAQMALCMTCVEQLL